MRVYDFSPDLVPETLCIYSHEHRLNTLKFFNNIQDEIHKENVKVHINLSEVKRATAAASLLFFAIITRAKLNFNDGKKVRFTWPIKAKNPNGHGYIVATGLSAALQASSISDLDDLTKNKRYFQSSVDPEEQLQSTRNFLLQNMNNPLNESQIELLTAAIGEAMINVRHHAYEIGDWERHKEYLGGARWWQCSWYNDEQDALYFIICDLGCGVVESYKDSHPNAEFEMGEEQILECAFSEGYSRFINQGRGNGSEDIKRPIEESKNEFKYENLLVLTNNSRYKYSIKQNKPSIDCHKFSSFLPGTIIEWCLIPERND
ncbi:hypothetical protein AB7309_21210 [Providencia manganoxydans]|uniref:hypothetical protein n=1 Tax=Providencia TaxID=586 RepID=UPI0034E2915C